MKVIIAGSRKVTDMNKIIKAIELSGYHITEVVCGMARGADLLGKEWADARGIPVKEMPANWYPNGVFDINAGYDRNHDMGDYADAAIVVFHEEVKGGSKDMMDYMKKVVKKPCFPLMPDYVDLFEEW